MLKYLSGYNILILACDDLENLLIGIQNDDNISSSEAEAESDRINLEKEIYIGMKDFLPELCVGLDRMYLGDNDSYYGNKSLDRSDRSDNNSDKEGVNAETLEIANFKEKSANEMERISKSAELYNSTNEHEEHDDDNDDNINLDEMLQLRQHENNGDYEEDDNFVMENDQNTDDDDDDDDDLVEVPEYNPGGNLNDYELVDFYNKVPGLEQILNAAIKRCQTGLPKANKKDKSDLFNKYRGKRYVFLKCIRYIYTKFQCRERPITAILKVFQLLWVPHLPLDVRSILRHSYDVRYYPLERGIHCCDLPVEKQVKDMLIEYQSMGEKLPKKLKIHFNADGLNTAKASNRKYYVFLLGFPQLKWDPIVMCHLLNGTPTNQIYYESTIKYLNKVQEHGIPDVLPNGDTLRVEVEGGFFDRQGLSNALWILSHGSSQGCPHCRIEGATLVSDRNDPRGRIPGSGSKKINFYQKLPSVELDWTMIVPARIDQLARARRESNVRRLDGQSPIPPIYEIFDDFDVVQQIPGCSLHQVYLGQKQLFQFIVTGEGASPSYKTYGKPETGEVYLMQIRIEKCHRFVTRKLFINRIPRSNFHENNQKYKGSEIRVLVLYCYPITLSVLRNEDIKRIGNTLFYLLRILENASLIQRFLGTNDEIKAFNRLLRELVEDYANVFGPQSITYNRHAWLHLAHWVVRFGPLSSWGTWRFENFNHHLASFLHVGSINSIKEACNRYLERCSTSFFMNWQKPKQFQPEYWLEEAKEVNVLKFIISCLHIVWALGQEASQIVYVF